MLAPCFLPARSHWSFLTDPLNASVRQASKGFLRRRPSVRLAPLGPANVEKKTYHGPFVVHSVFPADEHFNTTGTDSARVYLYWSLLTHAHRWSLTAESLHVGNFVHEKLRMGVISRPSLSLGPNEKSNCYTRLGRVYAGTLKEWMG